VPKAGTLVETGVTPDAYLGGSNVNLTTQITDKQYCNPDSLCKRSGAADSTGAPVLPAGGTDAQGHTLAQGQTPYRTQASNSSTQVFGLPEMMQQGIFIRNTTGTGNFVGTPTSTVRVTTVEAHGLVNGDTIFTSATNMAVNCATVARLDNNNFTYVSAASTAQARTGSWRKCATGSFTSDNNGKVTVNSTGHGLVTNDQVTTFVNGQTGISLSNVTVTVSGNTFTYTTTVKNLAATAGFWARTGLYNNDNTVSGTAISYSVSPIEWCSDVNLTNCKEIYPLVTPPNKPTGADSIFSIPAYVRFCKTQADALAPGSVAGTSVPLPQTNPVTPASARCQLSS
jgi:hypothetical protein